jgi:hypothetical protein
VQDLAYENTQRSDAKGTVKFTLPKGTGTNIPAKDMMGVRLLASGPSDQGAVPATTQNYTANFESYRHLLEQEAKPLKELQAPIEAAKALCAKYPLDALTAKAKAVTTTLSFRGFYLGMPMDEATAMLNHHHGEPTTNFWFGLVETNIHPMKLEKKWSNDLLPQLKTEPACAAGTADGKLTELTLDSGMLKKVFCLKDVNPSEFVARFAKEYNTSQPKYTPGKSGGAFIGSTGKVSSSDHWIITDEKTYEIMFTHRTGVESYMGLTGKVNEFSMTLQRPQGKFKD